MKTNFEGISAVFVDIDDTLWDFSANSPLALAETYRHFMGEAGWERFREVYVRKNNELWELYHHGKVSKDFLVTERFKSALQAIGYGDLSISVKMNDWYLNNLVERGTLVPGAKELLEYLTGRYHVYALSNGFAGFQYRKLVSGGIERYIEHMVLSDDVGITKPLPGIFEYAMNYAGTSPDASLMIGDNYDADISGAHNVGWSTIFFNRKGVEVEDSVADATVRTLNEIVGLL